MLFKEIKYPQNFPFYALNTGGGFTSDNNILTVYFNL